MNRFLVLAAMMLMVVCTTLHAEDYSFSHLTMQDGLSHNQVNDIFKDDDGFVWISTAWGLNRYDGYTFRHFVHSDADSASLANNYVNRVRRISSDKLLIASASNFQVYDCRTEVFTDLQKLYEQAGGPGWINDVFVDSKEKMWLTLDGVGAECVCFDLASGSIQPCTLSSVAGLRAVPVSAIGEDSDGMVFVMADGSLVRLFFNGDNIHTQHVETSIGGGQHMIFVDSHNDYWIWKKEHHGVWYYSRKGQKWHECSNAADSYFRVSDRQINAMAEDSRNRIWITTDHGGVDIVDCFTHTTTEIKADRSASRGLLSNSVNSVYADNNGIVWLGYFKSGMSIYDESVFKFSEDKLDDVVKDRDFTPDVNAIEEARDGSLWLGTNGSGLLHIDDRTGLKTLYRHSDSDPYSLPSDVIVSLLASSDGNLWIGTFNGGLARFDGRRFYNYKNMHGMPEPMTHENIWALREDADHNLWVGSLGKGVARYNLSTGETKTYTVESGVLNSDYVSSLAVGSDGYIYIGTAVGTMRIHSKDDSNVRTILSADSEDIWKAENVNDIYEDTRGLVWIGTRSGLLVNDVKTGKTWKLGVADGLANEVIAAITEDDNKNMWVSTAQGISNIVVERDARAGGLLFSVFNYTEQDGLQAMAFNIKSIERTSKGKIIVGGCFGLNSFVPRNIKYNSVVPEVHFVGLDVFGQKMGIGKQADGSCILKEAMQYADEITLAYGQNMFGIDFSTLSYVLPRKTRYSYCLEGFNETWFTTAEPRITFTNLTPGTYTLRVRAINCDGVESVQTKNLKITVLPPWWQTPWAYVVYILIVVGAAFMWRKQMQRKEHHKFRLRQMEAEVNRRLEVDQMKLKFFTNVSHELRTPLSLIISPLENLMHQTTDDELNRKLGVIHRNAHKLLELVNQLLDFRKADMGGMQLNLSEGDIVAFVCHVAENFKSVDDREMNYTVETGMGQLIMTFDTDKIGKVVNNLLSNAFKYTGDGGSIKLWVGKSDDGSKAVIRVSDTGYGIPNKYKESVFERFFQVPRSETLQGGSGIGLHLVREYVQLHGGEVTLEDNKDGVGSVFTVSLPLSEVHAEPEESVEPEAAEAEEMQAEEEAAMQNGRKVIMVVDDNADFRQLLTETLSDDYDIREARNGKVALQAILTEVPDLIITDVMMPEMDGTELCRAVKSDVRVSHIPLIMLTAKAADEHAIEGLNAGADEYITKPFNPQILRLKVQKLIDMSRHRQEVFSKQIDPTPSEITITPLDEQLLNKAIKYCEDNMASSELSVEELSRSLGMSRVHLYKKLMTITGRSPIEFIRVIRLKRAAQMLHDKQKNIADVAYAVGFNNPKYFSRYFKDEFGVLPSVYQSQCEQNTIETDLKKNK